MVPPRAPLPATRQLNTSVPADGRAGGGASRSSSSTRSRRSGCRRGDIDPGRVHVCAPSMTNPLSATISMAVRTFSDLGVDLRRHSPSSTGARGRDHGVSCSRCHSWPSSPSTPRAQPPVGYHSRCCHISSVKPKATKVARDSSWDRVQPGAAGLARRADLLKRSGGGATNRSRIETAASRRPEARRGLSSPSSSSGFAFLYLGAVTLGVNQYIVPCRRSAARRAFRCCCCRSAPAAALLEVDRPRIPRRAPRRPGVEPVRGGRQQRPCPSAARPHLYQGWGTASRATWRWAPCSASRFLRSAGRGRSSSRTSSWTRATRASVHPVSVHLTVSREDAATLVD